MATAHNEANVGDIAKIVLMSGDPLRIKYIAENYLEDAKLVNSIRNIYAYTGTYKGKTVTVMAHGMGMPSIGIYVYELFNHYGVEKIIRMGSAGTNSKDVNLLDLVIVDKSYTESNYAYEYNNEYCHLVSSSYDVTNKLEETAKRLGINVIRGNVLCNDCFDAYMPDYDKFINRLPKDLDLKAVDMESFALFYLAKLFNKEAGCILTVVDSHIKKQEMTAEERESSSDNMTKIALESIL